MNKAVRGQIGNFSKKGDGFTMVELLMTLVILAITISLGVPALGSVIEKSRRETEIAEIYDSFKLARQYAINSNTHVSICGSRTGLTCDGGWDEGFLVYSHDSTDNEFINKQQTPLLYHYEPGERFEIQGNINRFTYRPSGVLKGRSGSLLYCPKKNTRKNLRRLVISKGGRLRIYDPDQIAKKSYLSEMNC